MTRKKNGWLNLTRDVGEMVIITTPDGSQVKIIFAGMRAGQAQLSFFAPRSVVINRLEIQELQDKERRDEAEAISSEAESTSNVAANESSSERPDS